MNLAGFRNCLAEYTVHSLSPCYGLHTAFVLLNSVARWCNITQFFTKMVSFSMLVFSQKRCHFTWVSERIFPWGALVDFYRSFSTGTKSGEVWFLSLEIKKTAFLLKFSNSCPSSDTHMLMCRNKFVPNH